MRSAISTRMTAAMGCVFNTAMTTDTTSLRIIRSKECDHLTGTHDSQRYRLEAAGQFPRRVKISDKAVGWIEGEVLAWVKGRMALRDELEAYEAGLPPAMRHRLRMQRERARESEDEPAPA
jgi:prophage regulatory protein